MSNIADTLTNDARQAGRMYYRDHRNCSVERLNKLLEPERSEALPILLAGVILHADIFGLNDSDTKQGLVSAFIEGFKSLAISTNK